MISMVSMETMSREQLIEELELARAAIVMVDDAALKFYQEHKIEMLDTFTAKAVGDVRDRIYGGAE